MAACAADCAEAEGEEQAVMLVGDDGTITVVQPNEDGSYWRKIVRNKMIRMKESRRGKAAKKWIGALKGAEAAGATAGRVEAARAPPPHPTNRRARCSARPAPIP